MKLVVLAEVFWERSSCPFVLSRHCRESYQESCTDFISSCAAWTTIFVGSGGRPRCSKHADRC